MGGLLDARHVEQRRVIGTVEEEDLAVDQQRERGGESGTEEAVVRAALDDEPADDAVVAPHLIGDAQCGVDAPIERAVDVREVPVDAAHLESTDAAGVQCADLVDQRVVGPTPAREHLRLARCGGLTERGEVATENGTDRLDRRHLVVPRELRRTGAIGE